MTPRVYWDVIQEEVARVLGQGWTANIVARTVNAGRFEPLLKAGQWGAIGFGLAQEGRTVAAAGAEGLVVCAAALAPMADGLGRTSGQAVISMGEAVVRTLHQFSFHRVATGGRPGRIARNNGGRRNCGAFFRAQPAPEECRWLNAFLEAGPELGSESHRGLENRGSKTRITEVQA